MNETKPTSPTTAYNPPEIDRTTIRTDLSRNENLPVIEAYTLAHFELNARRISQYPDAKQLIQAIAVRHQVDPAQVVVTAGGDDAIDRTIRVCLAFNELAKRTILTHHPTFEMFDVYANASAGKLAGPVWMDGEFPIEQLFDQMTDDVAILALVTPNNPTGSSIPFAVLKSAVQRAEQQGLPVLVDLAYVEFAEIDPTEWLLTHSRAVIIRSFSKAFGLAGLRLGYALTSDRELAARIQNIAGPFPTSQPSLDLGLQALRDTERMQASVIDSNVRRNWLAEVLRSKGANVLPSDANFVLAHYSPAEPLYEKLLRRGIAVRIFPQRPLLKNCLRITVPRTTAEQALLASALGVSPNDTMSTQEPLKVNTMKSTDKPLSSDRNAQLIRETRETKISCQINLDRSGPPRVATGMGFFDHMLTALGVHSGIELQLQCEGDLHIDDHHSVEDCGLVIGSTISEALGDRKGIRRFGWALLPMDEALARVAIDLSGRPESVVNLQLVGERIGEVACENLTHFFQSLAVTLRCSLHVDILRGENDHHKAEAAFKGLAQALAMAIIRTGGTDVPSSKGML